MSNLFEKSINRLINGNAIFVLSDGYDGWSWGTPVKPVLFNYNEYLLLKDILYSKFNYDLEKEIINNSGYDCIFHDKISNFLGKRICQFYYTGTEKDYEDNINKWENIILKTEEEKKYAIETKEIILTKLLLDEKL